MAPKPFPTPIYVTKPALPALPQFTHHLDDMWSSKILSNQGPKHRALEGKLATLLRVPNVELFCNGTLALCLVLRALKIRGEVITTPFTFPATPHSIVWAGATPVFCDINADTLCLDPGGIEEAISPQTEAILGVHVYGVPCDVAAIEAIAKKHRLKVVYDAAHAFMTEIEGKPIGAFGDASMFSFHATKLFHTIEGGCITFSDQELGRQLRLLRNFGIKDEETVDEIGLNAKLNELQAAVGLEMLRILPTERTKRARVRQLYAEIFRSIGGLRLIDIPSGVGNSLQYLAVRVDAKKFGFTRDELHSSLKRYNIYTRKYFFPLCSDYECYRGAKQGDISEARRAAREILCFPFYGDLSADAVMQIGEIVHFIRESTTLAVKQPKKSARSSAA
jgi:dTDP-4-amino-4,6-dideoxygalactose transaminase